MLHCFSNIIWIYSQLFEFQKRIFHKGEGQKLTWTSGQIEMCLLSLIWGGGAFALIAPSGPVHIPHNRHQVIVIPQSHCQADSQAPELSQKLRTFGWQTNATATDNFLRPWEISSRLFCPRLSPWSPRQRLLWLLINPVTTGCSVHCLVETSGLAIIDLKCPRLPLPKPTCWWPRRLSMLQ